MSGGASNGCCPSARVRQSSRIARTAPNTGSSFSMALTAVVAAAEPPKPAKKVGGFKAWLNADQPPADGKKSGGSKGDKG